MPSIPGGFFYGVSEVAQLEEAAAGTEAEVVTTAPEQAEETQPNPADAYYPDDTLPEAEPQEGEQPEEPQDDDELEDDDDQGGEAEEPINAPVSLKAEEKERFSQLPREAQQMMSEVLSRRDRETQQGLETAKAAQRQAETDAADRIAKEQAQYAEIYDQLVSAFAPQPPSLELLHQDQGAYFYQKAIYEQQMEQFNQLTQGINGLRGQSDAHLQQQELEANRARVQDMMSIPEFANEETRTDFVKGIEAAGLELGYDPQSLALMDKRDMLAIQKASEWKADAEKWRAHRQKRNERPRAATGKFQAVPAGARTPAPKAENPLAALYPDD